MVTIKIENVYLNVATSEEKMIDILKELLKKSYITNHTQYDTICRNFNGLNGFIPELIFMLRDYFNRHNEIMTYTENGTPIQYTTSIFLSNSYHANAEIEIELGNRIDRVTAKTTALWHRSMELYNARAINVKYTTYGDTDEETKQVVWSSIDDPYSFRKWYYKKYDELHQVPQWKYLSFRNVREVASLHLYENIKETNLSKDKRVANYILKNLHANSITISDIETHTVYNFGNNRKKYKQGVKYKKSKKDFYTLMKSSKKSIRESKIDGKVYAGITKKGAGYIVVPKKVKLTKRLLSKSICSIIEEIKD